MKYTKTLYAVWERMIDRCYNPKNDKYKFYGGIGVGVCQEWRDSYQNFLEWALKSGWENGLQLDKDIKGNGKLYSPENCSWVTRKENQRARRHLLKVFYKGKWELLVVLCEQRNIKCAIVRQRMKRDGLTLEQALETPNTGGGNFKIRKRTRNEQTTSNAGRT